MSASNSHSHRLGWKDISEFVRIPYWRVTISHRREGKGLTGSLTDLFIFNVFRSTCLICIITQQVALHEQRSMRETVNKIQII